MSNDDINITAMNNRLLKTIFSFTTNLQSTYTSNSNRKLLSVVLYTSLPETYSTGFLYKRYLLNPTCTECCQRLQKMNMISHINDQKQKRICFLSVLKARLMESTFQEILFQILKVLIAIQYVQMYPHLDFPNIHLTLPRHIYNT